MMRVRELAMKIECLEDRCTPTAAGFAWADPGHLTMSFVPDGTQVGNLQSNLFSSLSTSSNGNPADWQREILRAFQSWTKETNANISIVPDQGLPLGVSGAVQGDSRFGDIRIAALPLEPGTIATNTPFQWSGTTWSGDIILNSNYNFGINGEADKYDLYTILLNESANVLGLEDSNTDATSARYFEYLGQKDGLNSTDKQLIQGMYGNRSADEYDSVRSNGTFTTATKVDAAKLPIEADISSATDKDIYSITVPAGKLPFSNATVRLTTAGFSSLVAKVSIFDSAQRLVASSSAVDALSGDITLNVSIPKAGGTYFLQVTAADGSVFGVGSYQLTAEVSGMPVPPTALAGPLAPALAGPIAPPKSGPSSPRANTSFETATELKQKDGSTDRRFDYFVQGDMTSTGTVSYFRILPPKGWEKQTATVRILLWANSSEQLSPKLELFDKQHRKLAFNVVANDGNSVAIEVPALLLKDEIFVKVNGRSASLKQSFSMAVDYNKDGLTTFDTVADNSLSSSATSLIGTMTIDENQLNGFRIAVNGSNGLAGIQMTIRDAAGNIVYTQSATVNGGASTGAVYLQAGTYTVEVTSTMDLDLTGPLAFQIQMRDLSDPIGPMTSGGLVSGTTSGTLPPSSGGTTIATAPSFLWVTPTFL